MKRREFIMLLGGAAACVALHGAGAAVANSGSGAFCGLHLRLMPANLVSAFRQGLIDAGYIEGRNITIEYRWADGHGDRLPRLAADLINRQVAVIVAAQRRCNGCTRRRTTTRYRSWVLWATIPFGTGLVANLNRPGGNVTGVSRLERLMFRGKRLGLLRELVPQSNVLAALLDINLVEFDQELRALEAASKTMDRRLVVVRVATAQDLDAAFTTIVQSGAERIACGKRSFFHFSATTPSVAFDAPCNSDQLHGS